MSEFIELSKAKSTNDREKNKFREGHDHGPATSIVDQSKVGWAKMLVDRPDNKTEVYTFYDKDNNVVDTITMEYTSSSREALVSAVRGAGVFE